jgi:hypothetical protein
VLLPSPPLRRIVDLGDAVPGFAVKVAELFA